MVDAVKRSNNDVGGGLINQSDAEFLIRGKGYIHDVKDLEEIVVGVDRRGVPVYVKNLGTVQLGGAIRRGLLDLNGEGEAVGGIIVMRYGENAKDVIDRVKAKIKELEKGLPPGVKIVAAYDRSDLISRAIDTLKHALTEEAIVVSLVVLLFLLHFRSALVIVITLPVAVLIAFITMKADGGDLQHHVARRDCHCHRCVGGCRSHHGGELLPAPFRTPTRKSGKKNVWRLYIDFRQTGGTGYILFPGHHRAILRAGLPPGRARRGNCFTRWPSPRLFP